MKKKLLGQAAVKFFFAVVLIACLIFISAGTLRFWQGWLFMLCLFVPILVAGIVLFARNPELLQKRLNAKETEKEQDAVVKLSGLMFIAGFIAAGLNHRFGWYTLPTAVSVGAAVVLLLSYLLYAEVMRENTYLSRTIEVQENQKVVDTGLYAIVRHPMYTATVLLFWAMPLVLGSIFAFVIFLPYPLLIVKRIKNEEKVLEEQLTGYRAYKEKVKFRLIPFVW